MDFCPVKVKPFLEPSVKVKIHKNGVFTFSNSFRNLAKLLPVFPGVEKVRHNLTFQFFPPFIRGKSKKVMITRGISAKAFKVRARILKKLPEHSAAVDGLTEEKKQGEEKMGNPENPNPVKVKQESRQKKSGVGMHEREMMGPYSGGKGKGLAGLLPLPPGMGGIGGISKGTSTEHNEGSPQIPRETILHDQSATASQAPQPKRMKWVRGKAIEIDVFL